MFISKMVFAALRLIPSHVSNRHPRSAEEILGVIRSLELADDANLKPLRQGFLFPNRSVYKKQIEA